jgi:hypothetical protein
MPVDGLFGTRTPIAEGIAAWVDSDAMSALLADFGRGPLPVGPLGDRLAALEAISAECWDYRKGLERHQAVGEEFPADRAARIEAAAAALGLADRQTPAYESYDHVLVLGGGVRTMVARADLAATVLRRGVRASKVAGLGSVRPLENQAVIARDLGLPECPTEGDAVDTLIGWAELVQPDPQGARLLLVTTDIFVPFQHCDALRLLTLPYGCVVDTIGFRTAPAPFQTLQEVRSAVRSMLALYVALE